MFRIRGGIKRSRSKFFRTILYENVGKTSQNTKIALENRSDQRRLRKKWLISEKKHEKRTTNNVKWRESRGVYDTGFLLGINISSFPFHPSFSAWLRCVYVVCSTFKMTESGAETTAATPVAAKTKKAAAPKKAAAKKAAPTHPPTAQMVNNAISSLKERGGSSLQAIKKYISSTYKVDAEKIAPFIKKYLKSAVDGGSLIRTKGKGASGSFKLAPTEGAKKKPAAKKPKAAAAKSPKPKKTVAKKPKAAAAKPKAAKPKPAKKSPVKAKKAAKAPAAKKAKSPKPKKASPKKTAKKAAPKK